jgi:hypothetical protein
MRLWSLHPRYLDPQGLVALWREALLAQAVLRGETRGYLNHPQLDRFRASASPPVAMSLYLKAVHAEAQLRGYGFDRSKIRPARKQIAIPVTSGQIDYEWSHLMAKLERRNPEHHRKWQRTIAPEQHPLFTLSAGGIEAWERVESSRSVE